MFFYTSLARAIGVIELKSSFTGETAIALVLRIVFAMFFDVFNWLTKSTFYFNRRRFISPKKWRLYTTINGLNT
ncbi:hypothetical protein XCR1_1920041 [Xenorhabdus cabanillasii JM26]|uniref:Uncharacterized protein n=1 Tax=Xenorhabdus cabanillasii JM26 TaxID=1427517 RepID=W1J3N9_9GAMM|nr:hypothetical protein XCR1_1920041 [Xenorhabdus cabanillasii JM26]